MAKTRKRKLPITTPYDAPPRPFEKPVSGPDLIRRFHVLLKRQDLLAAGSRSTSHELADIENEIERLGGLEAYQRMSERGQRDELGGGSQKVFVEWLLQKDVRKQCEYKGNRLKLLEVGAIKHDNYASHTTWIDCRPIDLRSRHTLIQQQDFLKMDEQAHRAQWDAISLSLVLNFVPNPHDRGKMLAFTYDFLREGGYLFLALPLPCVANSRYLDFDRLQCIMSALGFTMLNERWKQGGKMAYWLYQKNSGTQGMNIQDSRREAFARKVIVKEGKDRNNFTVLL